MEAVAMFPLSTVLMPGVALPLQLFEARYLQMLDDVLAGSGTIGFVLIERGSEVGGGDARFDVGTLARILDHRPLPDGRHAIVVGGEQRIRVERWLADDPYPRADITVWPDEPSNGDHDELESRYLAVVHKLRAFFAIATEFGHRVPPSTFEIHDEPGPGSYLLAALLPISPLDQQRLLDAPGPSARLEMISRLIDDAEDMIRISPTTPI